MLLKWVTVWKFYVSRKNKPRMPQMPWPPDTDRMDTAEYYGLNSTKSANKNTLCDNWYTVFRRNSRKIQDESVAGNAGVAGYTAQERTKL